ncbi:MAG: MCE family protein [Oligoflexia bacterium]|nr:MCE family protein [Oligoflexia bacterium]MBF0364325.1 MCE family protein [Oligoflexia bacterium]
MLNRSTENNYFKLGLFVLVGLILMVIALVIFGAGKLFQRTVNIETYFDESIQGIVEGSPVKYRGMKIGHVKTIAFVSEIYKYRTPKNPELSQLGEGYIYVKISITSSFFTQMNTSELKSMLEKSVAEGLRVKLTPQGLTGVAYLELNMVTPQRNPPIKIAWSPKDFYIPSTPSLIREFTEEAQDFFRQLRSLNLQQLFQNILLFAESAHRVAEKTDHLIAKTDHLMTSIERTVGHVDAPLEMVLQNLQITSENLRLFSEKIKVNPAQILRSSSPPPLDPRKL